MALTPGTRLGAYEIAELIGAGGMGEVYRARDTRLGRDVAVKVLPAALAADSERLHRFQQEARAAASLHHPNILAVYDIGEHDGFPYLVAEFLEGRTLRDVLIEGPLPLVRTVSLASQIARGLAAAHERDIVHRDLKPENLFVTSDEGLKILDFGLAKLAHQDPGVANLSAAPTTPAPTTAGTVLGTVGYMSPEQARGLPIDHRSDLFSLGSVLYEMVTGRRAFGGQTAADTTSAILTQEPPPISGPSSQHLEFDRIVRHCLEKLPERRFQSAGDVAFALQGLPQSLEMVGPREPDRASSMRPRHISSIAAVVVLGIWALAATTAYFRQSHSSELPALEFVVPAPEGSHFTGDGDVAVPQMAISPNGQRLVFVASGPGTLGQLWLRGLESAAAVALPGTENATCPFWSPDGRWIGFFAFGKLKKIDAMGGGPQTIAQAAGQARGGTWNADGVIVYAPGSNSELWRVSASGGEPTRVTSIDGTDERSHRWPQFLPDGRRFLYTSNRKGIYVGSLDSPSSQLLLNGDTNALHDSTGHLLFVRDGTLVAQRFDVDRLLLAGDAASVVDGVGFVPSTSVGAFSVSTSGVLVYARSGGTATRLEWFDRGGQSVGIIGEPSQYLHARLAPDQSRVAVAKLDPQTNAYDLFINEVLRPSSIRFTSGPANDRFPVWSPDGGSIAFASPGERTLSDVFIKTSNGNGEAKALVSSDVSKFPTDWSPDGAWIVYHELNQISGYDLRLVNVTTGQVSPLLQTPFNELLAQFSPDGKWIAYTSDESGGYEVYVQPFPSSGEKSMVSSAQGGSAPRWSRDGRELFYVANDERLMSVPLGPRARLEPGSPRPLFSLRPPGVGVQYGKDYSVSADGQRFLVNTRLPASNGSPLTVVLNWTRTLSK